MSTEPQPEPAGAGTPDGAAPTPGRMPPGAPDASIEVCGVEIDPEPAAPLASD